MTWPRFAPSRLTPLENIEHDSDIKENRKDTPKDNDKSMEP